MATKFSPQQDTGWGLIYRLNGLFNEVEVLSVDGQYDNWNMKLDRIWSNLIYRNPLEWKKDSEDNIIGVEFCDSDFKEKDYLDTQILKCKKEMKDSLSSLSQEEKEAGKITKGYIIAKRKLYKTLMIKEIWLRKFMHQLQLYLKEIEHNPAGAMWGK